MGALFSQEEIYDPKYTAKDYTKIRPGKDIYKIHKNIVYWRGEPVEGVRGDSFVDLGCGYGKDNFKVFHKGYILKLSNPKKFKVLKNNYAKDSTYVYYNGKIIENADVLSFSIDKNGRVSDAYAVYNKGNSKQKRASRSNARSNGRRRSI